MFFVGSNNEKNKTVTNWLEGSLQERHVMLTREL
jgi:hypothetical protein